MLADITQKPIQLLQTSETGCLGAALYAGIGTGVYKDVNEATKSVRIMKTYEPNPKNFAAYENAFKLHRPLRGPGRTHFLIGRQAFGHHNRNAVARDAVLRATDISGLQEGNK